MAAAESEPTTLPTDYLRVKRKKTTIFLYLEPTDTIHDLRARINHITKVPTTDVRFFIDINGEVEVVENKSLADQKVSIGLCWWMAGERCRRGTPRLRFAQKFAAFFPSSAFCC